MFYRVLLYANVCVWACVRVCVRACACVIWTYNDGYYFVCYMDDIVPCFVYCLKANRYHGMRYRKCVSFNVKMMGFIFIINLYLVNHTWEIAVGFYKYTHINNITFIFQNWNAMEYNSPCSRKISLHWTHAQHLIHNNPCFSRDCLHTTFELH